MKRLVLSLVIVCCLTSLIVLSACGGGTSNYLRTEDLKIADYAMPYTSEDLYKKFAVAHKSSTEYKLLEGRLQVVDDSTFLNKSEILCVRSDIRTDGGYDYVVFNYVLKKVVLEGSYGSIDFYDGYFKTNNPTAYYAEDGTLLTDEDISSVDADLDYNGGQISYLTSDNVRKSVTILKKNGGYFQSSINGDVSVVNENNVYTSDLWYSYNQIPKFNYYDKDDSNLSRFKFNIIQNLNDSYTVNISNGSEIRTAVFPKNTANVAYADGKLFYYTLTPVDPTQTSGYNLVYQIVRTNVTLKYLQEVFTYDLQNGNVEKISLPYAITNMCSLYNYTSKSYDALQLDIYMFNGGVAYCNEYTLPTRVIADNSGAVGYDFGTTQLNFADAVQLQSDILLVPTFDQNLESRPTYLVNDRGELGKLVGTQDKIVLDLENNQFKTVRNGKSGILNTQGTVWEDFIYEDIYLTSDYEIGLLGANSGSNEYRFLNVGGGTNTLSDMFGGKTVEFLSSSMAYAVIDTDTGFDFYTVGKEYIASISANTFNNSVVGDVAYVEFVDTNTSTYMTLLLN